MKIMSVQADIKAFEKRYIDLSLEFDSYVVNHIEFYDQIPDKAHLVFTVAKDPTFSEWSRSLLYRHRSRDPRVEIVKSGRTWLVKTLPATQ
jgi:hypothetical protein